MILNLIIIKQITAYACSDKELELLQKLQPDEVFADLSMTTDYLLNRLDE